jgi:beta-lactamase superfamily II metal-dependent hydrolase
MMYRKKVYGAIILAIVILGVILGVYWNHTVYLKSDELIMLSSQENAQMLSIVIRSQNKGLVVIDGGWEADGENLLKVIRKNGGHVNAWLITHPHSDHVGALYYILKNKKKDITIDQIYYSFAPLEWYHRVAPEDEGMVYKLLGEFAKLPAVILDDSINHGDQINVDDINITVMDNRYKLENDSVNNSSIVYKAVIKGKKLLILGDLGYEGGNQLLKNCLKDDLRADVVQMAHHGQNGVGKEVYEAISPKTCLWPTPEWLWNNDNGGGPGSGPWNSMETRQWMSEIGVKKNYCTKDGNIFLSF